VTGSSTSTTRAEDTAAEDIVVSTDGSPDGSGTSEDPINSVQEAFNMAAPGDTIRLRQGTYHEYIYVDRGGEPGNPITLSGPTEAILRPPKQPQEGRNILQIRRDHVHVEGCTFDGLADPTKKTEFEWYGAGIDVRPDPEVADHLVDCRIKPDAIGNTRGAMIMLRRVKDVDVGEFKVIGPAGVQHLYGDEEGHFGEIVYLGGGPAVPLEDDPWDSLYRSHDVHVHHIDNSGGYPHAEMVDVKGGNYDVTIEYCTDAGGSGRYILPRHDETSETAMNLIGSKTTLRWNRILDGHGQGVEVGAWGIAHPDRAAELSDRELSEKAQDSGQDNAIYGNEIRNNDGLAIQYRTDDDEFVRGMGPDAQQTVCGNEIAGETHGKPEKPCPPDIPRTDEIGHTGGDSPW
jgi:hypothetical protein